MAFTMPEIVVRRLIDLGIKELRANRPAFDDLFLYMDDKELNPDFGPNYRDQIWEWFSTTKIPVVQAWSFNAQKIPCISIHLANETEDETKASVGDYFGEGPRSEIGTAVFTVMVDVGIHVARGGDQVLWLYYIVSYILFKYKTLAERWGIQLQTYSASDYSKELNKEANNIWTRWIRFRCTTENYWSAEPFRQIDHVHTKPSIRGPVSEQLATSLDVNPCEVDRTANKGIIASHVGEDEEYEGLIDPDDINI